ncbi:cytochrome P450 [Obba rivulosa]|uniref:Cytochrome P450 n=1 Tax=Obba rivulosa TaxID=1052685 RepID=A0A8E2ANQ1_9APHY|nr:cytochrome P450 [Obba rivulosa]
MKGKLPPGPTGVPLLGNLLQVQKEAWLTFTEWKQKFGPIVHISLAGQSVVILNTHKAAADLLDRRANVYSDRPRNIVASEILTGGLLIVFTRYGEVWRRMRRAAHEGMNKAVASRYHPTQTAEAVTLCQGLLQDPDSWEDQFRKTAASSVMSIIYGTPAINSIDDPAVKKVNDFAERIVKAAYPGAHLVELFTWMKYLPSSIAKWKREAEEQFKRDSIMFEGMFNKVKKGVVNGDERPSISATLVLEQERNRLTEKEAAWLSATMYAAGAETTAGVLSWFMLAMVAHPEVQHKAHEELDRVLGRDRMPTFADYEALPYIRAIVKESLRWRPVDPLGLPHLCTDNDWYEGYYIPKGSICIANVWAMNRDPEVYGFDAEDFNPDRHLDEKGQLAPAPLDTHEEGHVTYGFGRRVCIGRNIANNSLFIEIACILWSMTIQPIRDADGELITPDISGCVQGGLVVRPVPFRCETIPRFAGVPSILAQTAEM